MLVKCNGDHGRGSIANQSVALLVVREFQKLLAEVVAKGVSHELNDMGSGLVENDLQVFCVALLKLLLQEAAAMLIFTQTVNLMARHGLQIVVHETVGIVLQAAALDDASLAILNTPVGSVCGVGVEVLTGTGVYAVRSVRRRTTVLSTH